jgi:hypothetical protein
MSLWKTRLLNYTKNGMLCYEMRYIYDMIPRYSRFTSFVKEVKV